MDDSEVLSSDFLGYRTSAASMTSTASMKVFYRNFCLPTIVEVPGCASFMKLTLRTFVVPHTT